MTKTKIEWADYSWNPIKGLCPVNCKTPDGKNYCYARAMYRRFGWDKEIRLDMSVPIELYGRIPDGSRIFVCSTFEIFHPSLPTYYRDYIFREIKDYKNLIFIILTKMPERIDRPMPDNVWLGVSVTGKNGDADRIRLLCLDAEAKLKFVSFEPLLADVAGWTGDIFPDYITCLLWVIVGRLTGHGYYWDPTKANIGRIVEQCREAGRPVFIKNNLREIWGEPLIQEFPR